MNQESGRGAFLNFQERLERIRERDPKNFLKIQIWTLKRWVENQAMNQSLKERHLEAIESGKLEGWLDLAEDLGINEKIDLELETLKNYEFWVQGQLKDYDPT